MLEKNKSVLENINLRGDYFNDEQSSFFCNKEGNLSFENEKSKKIYNTQIKYEQFQEIANNKIDELAEILVYIDTNSEEEMNKISKMYDMYEFQEIY